MAVLVASVNEADQSSFASVQKSKLLLELKSTKVAKHLHAKPKQGKALLKQKFSIGSKV